MGDGVRTVRVVTTDESVLASTNTSVEPFEAWEVLQVVSQEALVQNPPVPGDILILDNWLRGKNVYEFCRALAGRTRCRTYVLVERDNVLAGPIARFCGATGVIERPVTPSEMSKLLEEGEERVLPFDGRGVPGTFEPPEALLRSIATGKPDVQMIEALIDPATGLFNYAFLNFKLDEEFKRASRFEQALACVMLGFEGQADEQVLRQLAAIFLASSRDTDVLGRFDENSFVLLLPCTGPDGASIMAHRVADMAVEQGLTDLVGDPLSLSIGIATYPQPGVERRDDLYGLARTAFLDARQEGGGVIVRTG